MKDTPNINGITRYELIRLTETLKRHDLITILLNEHDTVNDLQSEVRLKGELQTCLTEAIAVQKDYIHEFENYVKILEDMLDREGLLPENLQLSSGRLQNSEPSFLKIIH